MDSTQLLVAAMVAVAVMGVGWFAVRFWLTLTRPADIKDVQTPALDRLNRRALERGAADEGEEDDDDGEDGEMRFGDDDDEEGDDAAPRGLTDIVPEENR